MSTKVLVPLDGSELAEAAVPYAAELAKALGWDVVLFRVIHRDTDRPLFMPATPVIEAGQDVWDRWEGRAEVEHQELRHEAAGAYDAMTGAAQHLAAAGLTVEREVGVGDSADTIVRRAASADVGLIAMASHGRTGLARLVRGSVASAVVRHTHRPALVVRPFRDPDRRVELEHADRLAPEQDDAVRRVIDALQA